MFRAASLFTLVALAAAPAAHADDLCLLAPMSPGPAKAPHDLRFGITPVVAGSAGGAQGQTVADDPARTMSALRSLRPPGRRLVLRFTRVFESEGDRAIARAADQVDAAARAGFQSEVQLRYHPDRAHNGDMRAWVAFVRRAANRLASRRALVALSITNEANFPVSSNTSDGGFRYPLNAIVDGIVAARDQLDRRRRHDVAVGFTIAWRYLPTSDSAFFSGIGARATRAFRAALGYVGVQLYPGLVWPPIAIPGRSAGLEVTDALSLIRNCELPKAGIGPRTPIWITENGYATNLGHSEARQRTELASTLAAVHAVSGTLNVTDYREFNLRDNRSHGTDLFDAVGLLRDDYSAKPAFSILRNAIASFGTRARRRLPSETNPRHWG